MSFGDVMLRFWPSATILSLIILFAIFLIDRAWHNKEFSRAETWTTNERTRVWWLKAGTTIAVVLCWIGALFTAFESPIWVDGAINWSLLAGYTYVLNVAVLAIVVIGLPALATAFWLKLLRHNWSDGEAPSTLMYFCNYSLWLLLIWSKPLIGW